MQDSSHQYPINSFTGRWTLVATIVASSMAFIDSTALNVVLPALQAEFEADATDLFWVLNSYLLMLAALIIVGGSLGDILGRVKVFQFGILIFTIGSILCGLSQDILQLIIYRAIQGFGGALMIPGSLAIISATFSKENKGRAIGIWSASTTIVTICGPLLGGALADQGLWRAIFYINVPLGLMCLIVLQTRVPESKMEGTHKIDWIGAILLVLSLSLITFGFLEMPELTFDNWIVRISLLLGLLFLVAFIIYESRIPEALIPLGLFRDKTFSGVNLLSFFLYAGLGGVMLFLSLNLIQIQGYSKLQAGMTFIPFSILMVSMARPMGQLTDKYGARNFLIMGPTITGVGFLLLAFIGITEGPSEYWVTFFPAFLVFAFGMSMTVVPLTTAVMSSVDDSQSGTASGINNSVTRIAGTFMNAVVGALALFLFGQYVAKSIEPMSFSEAEVLSIMEESRKLGEAQPPMFLNGQLQLSMIRIFENGFVNVYKIVAYLSAALAFLSAIIAVMTVPKKEKKPAR